MARGSKKIGPLFPMTGKQENKSNDSVKEEHPETPAQPAQQQEKGLEQPVSTESSKPPVDPQPEQEVEAAAIEEAPEKEQPGDTATPQQAQEKEQPAAKPVDVVEKEPEESSDESQVKELQPSSKPQVPKKDHLSQGNEKDDLVKELAAFRRALEEYKEELEWRPKAEITHNIPVPLPNPVYEKLKELEPYYTTKKIGFLQDQIVKGTIKQIEFLIQEVKEKKLKKKRKK
jgi:hypothetical protein